MGGAGSREWGLLLKVGVASGAAPAPAQLARILEELPGPDKRLTGGGSDFTVSWWVSAPDAPSAARQGADTLRALARAEGVTDLTFVRSHAASVEGRSPQFTGTEAHLSEPHTWAVDLKVAAPSGNGPLERELVDRVREKVGRSDVRVTLRNDQEKFLLDDGTGFTVRSWAAGAGPREAFGKLRRDVLRALEAVGLEGWQIVRFKARTPRNVHEDTFPGAAARTPRTTEETR